MVDKAFLVGVDDLQEMCKELKNYSLSVKPGNITITQHDGDDGLNEISFAFPIVADFSILSALYKNPASGLQVCLHVYTGREVRQSTRKGSTPVECFLGVRDIHGFHSA